MHNLYYLAKADFLQRIRSRAFLITLGFCICLTFTFIPAPGAIYSTVTLGNYQGLVTSSWIGTMVAMMSSIFLSLMGFYLVNNSIDRDYRIGVGQIIATTRIKRFKYIAGKALSNFFVLLTLMFIIALTATGIFLAYNESGEFSALELYSPFVWITVPALLFIASLSAFTECFRKVNRGIVNIVFLFLFVFFVALSEMPSSNRAVQVLDLFGTSQAFGIVKDDLRKQVKDYNGQHSIGYSFDNKSSEVEIIRLGDLHPKLKIVLARSIWILLGIFLVLTGAWHFKRFDPAYEPQRKNRAVEIKPNYFPKKYIFLPKPKLNFALLPMVKAEIKLMLKGLPLWWWFLILVLFVATVFSELSISRNYLLPFLLLLQIGIWSFLGCREKIYRTEQTIYTTPKVLTRQLFAGWFASFLWALFLSSAVLIRLALEHDYYSLFAVITGAIFIPALALFGGIYSGGPKFFQIIYVILFYGFIQEIPFLDYLGATSTSLKYGMPFILLGTSLALLVLCWFGRRKQIVT